MLLALAALALLPMRAGAQADELVGTWVAEDRLRIQLWLEIERAGDGLEARCGIWGDAEALLPATVRVDGARVELGLDEDDSDERTEPDYRIVLERAADGASLRVVEVAPAIRGVRVGLVVPRRDRLYEVMRGDLRDLAHEDDGRAYGDDDLLYYEGLVDAVREGVVAAGRAAALRDLRDALTLLEVAARVWDETRGRPRACRPARPATCAAPYARARSLATELVRQAAGRALESVDVSTLEAATPGEPGGCASITVSDGDGATTVRQEPSSRAPVAGTLPNGTRLRVEERRGHWIRVGGATAGWVYDANVTCGS